MDEENQFLVSGETDASANDNDLQANDDAGDYGENDEYGEPEITAEAPETPGDAAQETQAPQTQTQTPYTPQAFQYTGNPHIDRARQRLEEYGLGEIADDLYAAIRHEQAQGFSAQTYAGSYLGELQQADPDYYQQYAGEINAAMAQLPMEIRATKQGAWLAWQAPYLNRITQTGSLTDAVKLARQGNVQRSLPPPARPLQQSPRTPSPGAGGGGGAPARAPEANGTKQAGSRAARFLQDLGFDDSEARKLAREL